MTTQGHSRSSILQILKDDVLLLALLPNEGSRQTDGALYTAVMQTRCENDTNTKYKANLYSAVSRKRIGGAWRQCRQVVKVIQVGYIKRGLLISYSKLDVN